MGNIRRYVTFKYKIKDRACGGGNLLGFIWVCRVLHLCEARAEGERIAG